MVRSAATSFRDVAIVTSSDDYVAIAQEMADNDGALGLATRWRLAQKAFATTAAYDSAIASTLSKISFNANDAEHQFQLPREQPSQNNDFPAALHFTLTKTMDLRYGENPHQRAAMYSDGSTTGVANGKQLQGKELSYNNIVDLQAAWELAQEFDETVCAIIKHTNP